MDIPYTAMNTELRQSEKIIFRKIFSSFWNNSSFGKTIKNVRKYADVKLETRERRINYLVSDPNYHTTIFFTENLLAIEIKKLKY